ncbi:hypothetical protein [Parasitella parasitica]|uniref:Uncharacterized protein n=1 Tax=Parasitella parasitica TaxID=35722 RepID=A0A0B7N545_9FUNG|nr:hypothetical protein [Parasitella parasitica]
MLDMNDILANNRLGLKTMDGFDPVFTTTDSQHEHSSSEQSSSIERMHTLLNEESSNTADPDSFHLIKS